MNVAQISFSVSSTVYNAMAKRAGPLNVRPAEYARRLFEAAWAARVAGERGVPTEDRALDHQVQQVFLLADCEPEYIAEALKLPIERVTRILDGWRQVARELVEPPAQEKPAETPPPSDGAAEPRGRMTAEEIAVLRNLWREGKPIPVIAATLERTPKAIEQFAARNRDICPARRASA